MCNLLSHGAPLRVRKFIYTSRIVTEVTVNDLLQLRLKSRIEEWFLNGSHHKIEIILSQEPLDEGNVLSLVIRPLSHYSLDDRSVSRLQWKLDNFSHLSLSII